MEKTKMTDENNSTLEDDIKRRIRYLETFYQSDRNHLVLCEIKGIKEDIKKALQLFKEKCDNGVLGYFATDSDLKKIFGGLVE